MAVHGTRGDGGRQDPAAIAGLALSASGGVAADSVILPVAGSAIRVATATTGTVGRINRTAITELLRDRGPLSRTEIGELLGLSAAAVNRLVASLMKQNVLVAPGLGPSTGGRPPVLLHYNARAASILVLDVGGTKTAGGVSDLKGELVFRSVQPSVVDSDGPDMAQATLARVLAFARGLKSASLDLGLVPRAVAIGAPGIVHPLEQRVEWAPAVAWRDLPLGSIVGEALGVPTFVENDVNLMALGEHRRGAGIGTQHMVALTIGLGIGAGLILDGHLYHGWGNGAGEIGYMLLDRQALSRNYPGFGDFESRAAAPGIVRRAESRGVRPPRAVAKLTAADVTDAARGGDVAAQAALDEVIDDLALAIGNLSAMVSPELVVIGGGVSRAADLMIPGILERLTGRIPLLPRIVQSALGEDAVLHGAVELAIQATTDSAYVVS